MASTSRLPARPALDASTWSSLPSSARATPDSDDSEDEAAWDEVDVAVDQRASVLAAAAKAARGDGMVGEEGGISIVLGRQEKGKGTKKKKGDGSVARDRMVRQERHKLHTVCLLTTALIRNRWLNDTLLQARLLSRVPIHLVNAFGSFNKQTHPNERDRSRLFDQAIKDLTSWWFQSFHIQQTKGIVRRPVHDVDDALEEWKKGGGKWEDIVQDEEGGKAKKREKKGDDNFIAGGGEQIRTPNTLMKHALIMKGSKDLSVQLFTSLCRALDIPTRLIFSLQPVDWRAPSVAFKGKRKVSVKADGASEVGSEVDVKGKGRAVGGRKVSVPKSVSKRAAAPEVLVIDSSEGEDDWEDGRGKTTYTLPTVNLRRTKLAKRNVNRSPSPDAEELSRPPVFWTEVWNRSNRHWFPVDVIRKKMRCAPNMEPVRSNVENQMIYVVAFEEDGSARDITPRYAKAYNSLTVKARVPSRKGTDWFADLLGPYQRSFLLNRDREEFEELWSRKAYEPMPTSLGAFKNHPSFVLEQHLKRDEALLPGTKEVGKLKGSEPVYPRSAVVHVKSSENWYRIGRIVGEEEEPMKYVKQRNATINKARIEAAALIEGNAPTQQGLFAESQTQVYVPPPVVDGKVPKNSFGNIDLFVPSMLPQGAIHLPSKGAAKCAKLLGVDFAEAIIGFDFRQRRALPTMAGIVVAAESAELLYEAIFNLDQMAEEKEFLKQQERALKRWKKLIAGLRIRHRLDAAYGNGIADATVLADKQSQLRMEVDEPVPQPPPPTKRRRSPTPEVAKRSTTGRSLRLTVSSPQNPIVDPNESDSSLEMLSDF